MKKSRTHFESVMKNSKCQEESQSKKVEKGQKVIVKIKKVSCIYFEVIFPHDPNKHLSRIITSFKIKVSINRHRLICSFAGFFYFSFQLKDLLN